MPILPVALDGEKPSLRTIQLRTQRLVSGVLCEVWADERMHLCLALTAMVQSVPVDCLRSAVRRT